jgi:hypothetical protein
MDAPPQVLGRPVRQRVVLPQLLASNTSIFTPKRSSKAFQVRIVSSNSTPVSIVTTRTARPVP